jgi:hypothetical protein
MQNDVYRLRPVPDDKNGTFMAFSQVGAETWILAATLVTNRR